MTECQQTRRSITAGRRYRLDLQGPGEDPAAAEVVAHLLADYDRPGAHEFALAWLNALFAARPGGQPGSSAHAAAQSTQAADKEPHGGTADSAGAGSGSPTAGGQGGASEAAPSGAAPSAYESVLIALLGGLRCYILQWLCVRRLTYLTEKHRGHIGAFHWSWCNVVWLSSSIMRDLNTAPLIMRLAPPATDKQRSLARPAVVQRS